MSREEICHHERAEMAIRHTLGFDQRDAHVWCWLLWELHLWGLDHPIRVKAQE